MGKMPQRKDISASTRWTVFARDGFACRYCGVRAGQDGVQLHVDHVISIADGGDNSIDNLLAACQRCNGGKGAKSLRNIPEAEAVADRMKERAKSVAKQAKAMRAALTHEKELEQQAINLKCEAYRVKSTDMERGEIGHILRLCREFGAETVMDWYRAAAGRGVREHRAIKYVCGCARNVRDQQAGGSGA
jgi:hypothetical protein